MKPVLLLLIAMSRPRRDRLAQTFEVVNAPDAQSRAEALSRDGPRVRIVLTNGSIGITGAEMDRLPALSLVCAMGAGYENVDVGRARARGLTVINGPGTNDSCAADHAMALVLATLRGLPQLDRACRAGLWRDEIPMPRSVTGKRLGILGLGHIGRKIALRAAAFEMEVGYCSRTARLELAYPCFGDAVALAAWCDVLVVATPGGAQTRHLVDARVLQALGPAGLLVNIARGSVVDTQALAQALRDRTILGAGIDVYEGEPAPPADLLEFDQVILTPHVAGWSDRAIDSSVELFLDNARRHLAGEAVLTPV
jgi:lactate dehydrogenase-like 2-hydroxyacid dehydrogenase